MKRVTNVLEFPVVVEKDKEGYFGYCPSLQGCYTQGETYEEVLKNLEDAVKLHIKDKEECRESIPVFESISLTTVKVVA